MTGMEKNKNSYKLIRTKLMMIGILLLTSFYQSGYGQTETLPVRFQLKLVYFYSDLQESCNTGREADHVLNFKVNVNGGHVKDLPYDKDNQNRWEQWPNLMYYDAELAQMPMLDMNILAHEESGWPCKSNQYIDCWKNIPPSKLLTYQPGIWHDIDLECYAPVTGRTVRVVFQFWYSPLQPMKPFTTSGDYTFCGGDVFTIKVDDVSGFDESYTWSVSHNPGHTFVPVGAPFTTVRTVTTPDVSRPETWHYRVFSNINNTLSAPSPNTAITYMPRRPVIAPSDIVPESPLCYAGDNGKVTLKAVNGRLGTGVSKYRITLEKLLNGNWQKLSLYDPYIYSLPYTLDKSKVFGGLKAGDYRLLLENVVDGQQASSCPSSFVSFKILETPEINFSAIAQKVGTSNYHISCNGKEDGKITLTATGGTPPYQYLVGGGGIYHTTDPVYASGQSYILDSLRPEVYYQFMVTDKNGCIKKSPFITLTEPDKVEASVYLNSYPGGFNIRCMGSTDTCAFLVKGGVLPYTITSEGISKHVQVSDEVAYFDLLKANKSYVFTITDANGCSLAIDTTLTEPEGIKISRFLLTGCNGEGNGSAFVEAKGGLVNAGKYTYELNKDQQADSQHGSSASFEDLQAGTYMLTIKDLNECTKDTSFYVPVSANAPELPDTVICTGTSYTLSLNAAEYSYQWTSGNGFSSLSDKISVSTPGEYRLQVTNKDGCKDTTSFNLAVSDNMFQAVFAVPTEVMEGDSIAIGEVSWPVPTKVEWDIPSAFEIYDSDMDGALQFARVTEQGVYTIRLTGYLGECRDEYERKIYVYERDSSDMEQLNLGHKGITDLKIYPNPNTGIFTLKAETSEPMPIEIEVYDLNKATPITSKKVESGKIYLIDFHLQLAQGTYSIVVKTPNDQQSIKFIVY